MRLERIITVMLAASLNFAAACAGPPDQHTPTGEVKFALHSTVGDVTYELRNATFSITGTAERELSSEDAPDAAVLEEELPVGDYAAELGPDWHLFEVVGAEETELDAVLASENPAEFSIASKRRPRSSTGSTSTEPTWRSHPGPCASASTSPSHRARPTQGREAANR